MLLVAYGMWKAKYWAVLGMHALLAILILVFSLLAVKAENVFELLIALAVIGSAGTLFWFLIKAMARIQMPPRPGSQPR
jgi:multisubunit Na+/H+ antiporter MnhC subunit